MRVIKGPVIYSSAGYAVMELVRGLHQEHRGHSASERESLYSDLVAVHIWQGLEPVRPCAEVLDFPYSQLPVYHVKAGTAVMACGARVDCDLDDAVIGIPLIDSIRSHPSVAYHRGVRTAIDVDMHRIFLRLIEVLRIYYRCREPETVFRGHEHEFTQCIL